MSEKPPEPERPFTEMAERINRNGSHTEFGGAFVIQPPGGRDPIVTYILDPNQDIVQFFGLIQTRIQIELNKLSEEQQNGGAIYGGGRR